MKLDLSIQYDKSKATHYFSQLLDKGAKIELKEIKPLELTENEIELIFQNERKKYEDSSWGVELDYHKETFTSGIDALVEYINSK